MVVWFLILVRSCILHELEAFLFQLSKSEYDFLISQFVTSKKSGKSGVRKMLKLCSLAGLPVPHFEEYQSGFLVEFRKDIYTEEYLRKLGLNERQIKVVMYVKENDKIANQEYQVICETSNRTATRDLTELVSLKIFQQIGTTGKGTKYVLRRQRRNKHAIKTPKGIVYE